MTSRSWAYLGLGLPSVALASPIDQSGQLMLVLSDGFDAPRATMYRFERSRLDQPLTRVGRPLPVWLGRSGLAWRSDPGATNPPTDGPKKREGDGRSPAGFLSLDELWGYAETPPSGVKLPYKQATTQDRCVDDVASPDYNQLVKQVGVPSWRSAEQLRMPTDHYKFLVVLGYNRKPVRPGSGSCIFLHVAPEPQGPTAGCTALTEPDLLELLRWIDPARSPLLLQLPKPSLTATVKAWRLPVALTSLSHVPKKPPAARPGSAQSRR